MKKDSHFEYDEGWRIGMKIKKLLIASFFFLLTLMSTPFSVLATSFDLIAPSGQLARGQEVKFTININTDGKSLSSTAIGMTYETQYLEYISTAPGNTFTTVSTDVQNGGKLVITGSSATPYSGSGVFAYVTFKIIATSSGSTQLCTLYNPATPTSTPGPSSAPVSSPTPGQNIPAPTSLPKTGETKSASQGIILASFFFVVAGIGFFVFKKT